MKVLVTGARGQLGQDLCDQLHTRGAELVTPDRQQMDFLRPESIADTIQAASPDWVVNCAAYTRVDNAEAEPEAAFCINRDAARLVAQAASAVNAGMLHISTDFVFSGAHDQPYEETDATGPLSVYGRSKQEGELAVQEACPGSIIVRTSWLYGARGRNFVKTVLRLARERDELRIVSDQTGSPTWTRDLAAALWQLMQRRAAGVFHYSNGGQASWYEFACAIVEEARDLGFALKPGRITPVATREYPTPATRPAYSVLSREKIQSLLDQPIPDWRQSLRLMLEELQQCPDC